VPAVKAHATAGRRGIMLRRRVRSRHFATALASNKLRKSRDQCRDPPAILVALQAILLLFLELGGGFAGPVRQAALPTTKIAPG
jgi:hypothetical protein